MLIDTTRSVTKAVHQAAYLYECRWQVYPAVVYGFLQPEASYDQPSVVVVEPDVADHELNCPLFGAAMASCVFRLLSPLAKLLLEHVHKIRKGGVIRE